MLVEVGEKKEKLRKFRLILMRFPYHFVGFRDH